MAAKITTFQWYPNSSLTPFVYLAGIQFIKTGHAPEGGLNLRKERPFTLFIFASDQLPGKCGGKFPTKNSIDSLQKISGMQPNCRVLLYWTIFEAIIMWDRYFGLRTLFDSPPYIYAVSQPVLLIEKFTKLRWEQLKPYSGNIFTKPLML